MNNGQIPSARNRIPLRQRIEKWGRILRFASTRGDSVTDRFRLFYYAGLKLSLVFHGFTRHSPERILSFSFRATDKRTFRVFARDNGLDVGTFAEFFESRHDMVPAELPLLQPKVIYDLGANVGAASLYFAAKYPDARVFGFEPVPANYEICVLNYRNLSQAQAFPWAVGARSERAVFECQNDPRGGRLSGSLANPGLQPTQKIDVHIFSIADLIEVQNLEPPEFLKIDVEGAEMEVLKGMERYVHSVKRMFVETHSPELRAECLQWMLARGFRIYRSIDPTALWGDRV